MAAEPTYRSDARPDFAPFEESCGTITGFAYARRSGDASLRPAESTAPGPSTSSTTCSPSASSRR